MALTPNWTNLAGSLLGYIRLGLTGVRLKNSAGVLAVRDAGDSVDAGITASTLVASGQVSLGGAAGAEALRTVVVASAVNRWQMGGGASTNGPYLEAVGTATNLTCSYYSKGTGVHDFFTAGGTRQFQVGHTASAVNYGKMAGGATGTAVTWTAVGTDTNIGMTVIPKGSGVFAVSGPATFTTVNALTLTALATGFSLAGGTTSKTLTVDTDATVSMIGVGLYSMYFPVELMSPRSTNGAAAGTLTAGGLTLRTYDFDSTSDEYVSITFRPPKRWSEATNCTFVLVWSHPATTVNFGVVWSVRFDVSGDDEQPVVGGSPAIVTDTGGTTSDYYITAASGGIAPNSGTPGAEEMLTIGISRNVGHASDTMAVDAKLIGVTMYYTTHAATDA